jgi:hypothetical protein
MAAQILSVCGESQFWATVRLTFKRGGYGATTARSRCNVTALLSTELMPEMSERWSR